MILLKNFVNLFCKIIIIILNRKESSFIGSPKWLKNKKATINPKNNGNNGFQYALTAALNYQNINPNLGWGGGGGNFTPPPPPFGFPLINQKR